MKSILVALVAGLLFGLGLDVGGMTNPENIIGFLDFAGDWNPSLLFVMGGAVVVTFIGYRLTFRKSKPIWAPRFQLPEKSDIDARLMTGAAIFGIGWGIGGYCPGPAFSSLSLNDSGVSVFVGTMLIGMLTAKIGIGVFYKVWFARQES